jgi:adenylate cyclase
MAPRPRRAGRRALLRGVGLALVAVAGVAALSGTHAFRGFEERAEGALVSLAGPRPLHPGVVLVVVDEPTLRRLDWPVPRQAYAVVLDALVRAGARSVAYDIMFVGQAVDGPAADQLFAGVARNYGRAVLAVECNRDPASPRLPDDLGLPIDTPVPGACVGAEAPHGPLLRAAGLAQVQVAPSVSGVARGLQTFAALGGRRLPTLALAAVAAGSGTPPDEVARAADLGPEVLASVRAISDDRVLPFDRLLDETSASDTGELTEATARLVRGSHVLVGQTAPSLGDYGPLATGDVRPLLYLHAALLSDLLEGRVVRALPPAGSMALAVGLGVALALASLLLRPWVAGACAVGAILAVVGAAVWALDRGVLIPPVAPVLSCVLAVSAAFASRLTAEDRERRLLIQAFGAYVDRDVLDRLLADPARYLSLGGARRVVTILFSDIKGYTGLSNQLPPEDVLSLLREYLEAMTFLVKSTGGRVDKIMGDGILAVFGDPVPALDHAPRAVEVGLQMQRVIASMRQHWMERLGAEVSIRIGIATGEVFVGNIGSSQAKIEYTAIGPTVNLASRLENVAPAGGVLVSEETRRACGDQFEFTPMPGLVLKGFSGEYMAYLVNARGERREERGEPGSGGQEAVSLRPRL